MAERAPFSDDQDPVPPSEQSQLSAQPDDQPAFRPGTYVVQVPKDQIYRIPPPENALIAERHRNPALRNKKKRPCSSCCFWVCISVLLVVLVLSAIVATFHHVSINPKNPTFDVECVAVKNNSDSRNDQLLFNPEYNITLRANNPNAKVGILYKEGGVVSLSFREREIGTGNYPTFLQDHTDSTVFGIIFQGSNVIELPTEIERSMNSQMQKVQVTFSLKMDLPAGLRNVGLLNRGSIKFVVGCNFTVDTLAKDTHILSRKCQTYR